MDLASIVNYSLPPDELKDQGVDGRFEARHADKQLVAYFVSNHVVLGDDEESLKEAVPPIMLRTASIIVSNPVCANCRDFIKQVNTVLHLDLQATRV
jgi:hypothetical protein